MERKEIEGENQSPLPRLGEPWTWKTFSVLCWIYVEVLDALETSLPIAFNTLFPLC